jgi:hypothetical protein
MDQNSSDITKTQFTNHMFLKIQHVKFHGFPSTPRMSNRHFQYLFFLLQQLLIKMCPEGTCRTAN